MEKIYYKKSEMIELGYSEYMLRRIAHAEGAPVLRTGAGGNFLYRLQDIDAFVIELNRRDEAQKKKREMFQKARRAYRRA